MWAHTSSARISNEQRAENLKQWRTVHTEQESSRRQRNMDMLKNIKENKYADEKEQMRQWREYLYNIRGSEKIEDAFKALGLEQLSRADSRYEFDVLEQFPTYKNLEESKEDDELTEKVRPSVLPFPHHYADAAPPNSLKQIVASGLDGQHISRLTLEKEEWENLKNRLLCGDEHGIRSWWAERPHLESKICPPKRSEYRPNDSRSSSFFS